MTHLGPGAGVAQEVGAGDQAVPEAATPTAPHTAVAASDCDTGGGRARGDGSAHLGSRAAGRCLVGRLPTRPAQHSTGAQVVLGGVPRAAAVGALRRETRLRRDGESGTGCSGPAPRLRAPTRSQSPGRKVGSVPREPKATGTWEVRDWEEGCERAGGSERPGDRERWFGLL